MSQIALPLDWPSPGEERDFVVTDGNRLIAHHLTHWALWPVMATLLVGPRKSGRSLVGRIFAARTAGELVDDAPDQPEEALFHAWNRAQERRVPLLIIAHAPPPAWQVVLPDLQSRLAATPVITMPPPDEELAAALLEKLLLRRGLAAPMELIRYLVPRLERTHLAIHRTVDALDGLALERRQRLTIPLARRALTESGVLSDD